MAASCSTASFVLNFVLALQHADVYFAAAVDMAPQIGRIDTQRRREAPRARAIYFGRRGMDHIVMVGTTFIDRWHWIDRCARRAANIRQPHLESTTRLVPLTLPIRE